MYRLHPITLDNYKIREHGYYTVVKYDSNVRMCRRRFSSRISRYFRYLWPWFNDVIIMTCHFVRDCNCTYLSERKFCRELMSFYPIRRYERRRYRWWYLPHVYNNIIIYMIFLRNIFTHRVRKYQTRSYFKRAISTSNGHRRRSGAERNNIRVFLAIRLEPLMAVGSIPGRNHNHVVTSLRAAGYPAIASRHRN